MSDNLPENEWPNPRDFKHYNTIREIGPPEIPNVYEIFGLNFENKKTHVKLISEEYADLDLQEIRDMVNRSYELFKEILKNPNNKELLGELRDLHLTMNIKINNAKRWELENLIK